MSLDFTKNLLLIDSFSNKLYSDVLTIQKSHNYVDTYISFAPLLMLNIMRSGFLYRYKQIVNSYIIKDIFYAFKSLNLTNNTNIVFDIKLLLDHVKPNISNIYNNDYMHYSTIMLLNHDYDKLLNDTVYFASKITTNGLKILCFIALTLFQYYVKIKFSDNWITKLKNILMDGELDKYIQKYVNQTEKKQFIVALIQYENLTINEHFYSYLRIDELEQCFITKIKDCINYIPGTVPDQLFFISYEFFKNIKNQENILQDICSNYIDSIPVGFYTSFYYFSNNNNDLYKFFINDHDKEINELSFYFSLII